MSTARYRGTTARGRVFVADSLAECVAGLEGAISLPPGSAVTAQDLDRATPETWYVYESQAALEVDEQRASGIGPNSPGWYARITLEDRPPPGSRTAK